MENLDMSRKIAHRRQKPRVLALPSVTARCPRRGLVSAPDAAGKMTRQDIIEHRKSKEGIAGPLEWSRLLPAILASFRCKSSKATIGRALAQPNVQLVS
jgi:hypothetical protein